MELYGDLQDGPLYQPSQEYRHEYSGNRRQKVFNDSVHGHFSLHRSSVAILDTPQFQRLRNLKQLGLAYKIYPSASHNRFEHSLGVAHLASSWAKSLLGSRDGVGEDGWPRSRLEPEDRQHMSMLQLAGLTHDLGHGPFSHVFEKELLPRLGLDDGVVKSWEHEIMSEKIFDHILDDCDNDIDLQVLAHLSEDQVRLIKCLMHGSKAPHLEYPTAPWLFDVVANKRNGVDVDRFDYLARDAMMCGVDIPLKAERLMLFSRISPHRDMVTFKSTEYSNLAVGLFQSRSEMHRRVYTHQKIKSVEFMACDALALAAGPLGLLEAVGPQADIENYINLDDSILQRIKLLEPERYEHPRNVEKAKALLQQLERRNLYKYVSEVTLDVDAQRRYSADGQGKPTAEEVVGYHSSADSGVVLKPGDVIVCEIHVDQGMKAHNPMASVRFYQTSDEQAGDEPFAMPQQQISSMLGTVYQDKIIRVYSKNPDPAVIKALKKTFTKWSQARHNCQPHGTPWKQPPTYAPNSITQLGNCPSSATDMAHLSANDDNGQHMGSGGRSRKRSLHPDMAAAAAAAANSQADQQAACNADSSRLSKFSRVGNNGLPGIAEEDEH